MQNAVRFRTEGGKPHTPRQPGLPINGHRPALMPSAPTTWAALTADQQDTAEDVLHGLALAGQDGAFGGWVLQAVADLSAEGLSRDALRAASASAARMKGGRELLDEEARATGADLDAVGRRFYRYFAKVARSMRDEAAAPDNVVALRAQGGRQA
ncbi:hypothetical protein J5Y09_18750 [Roseomonas sp. PWR1]|uniref:Phasin protein n=1 Tax=Roseomonas nitratireducens TaxID=2820810 RepID=A0ABS4AYT7_9PROT|nr:hypothetical protein [Neoroseomonas nitratireducens]MBP0465973.1 hypothetical protein [Neoroseomonas nitratireducens]